MDFRKLSDSQVTTLAFVLCHKPPPPMDIDRFPNLRMFLEDGIVRKIDNLLDGSMLYVNAETPEYALADFGFDWLLDRIGNGPKTFAALEQAGNVRFRDTTEHIPEDTFFVYDSVTLRDQIAELGGKLFFWSGNVDMPEDAAKKEQAQILIDAYQAKYPLEKKEVQVN